MDDAGFVLWIADLIAAHRLKAVYNPKDRSTTWVCRSCDYREVPSAERPVLTIEAEHQASVIVDDLGLVEWDEELLVENVETGGRP